MPLNEWDPRRGRGGRRWRELTREVCPPGSMCEAERCKASTREIIFGLRRNHPLGPSVDHIVSLKKGGHPTARENLRPAHFGCNSSRGSGEHEQRRPRSRNWAV
ncbi:HNH endonuclease [Demequina gelatinilytica]|uniref:HNH endonuclease n=1 Tax=Demequina gelatinilytica TaxID=1638980 RepID=UPI000B152F86|nr:HNH endonuclease [Demequina gelatinilytica]